MTDSDTRTLRSYLTNCLEPALKLAKEQVSAYEAEKAAACRAGEDFTAQYALGMKRWAEGKVSATEAAIAEFEELFSEELQLTDKGEGE